MFRTYRWGHGDCESFTGTPGLQVVNLDACRLTGPAASLGGEEPEVNGTIEPLAGDAGLPGCFAEGEEFGHGGAHPVERSGYLGRASRAGGSEGVQREGGMRTSLPRPVGNTSCDHRHK